MSRAYFQVKKEDKGLDALFARVNKNSGIMPVEVGSFGDAETTYIAKVHELGLGNNPQRSFLRSTFALYRQKYMALSARAYAKFLDGQWTMDQALTAVGNEMVTDVKRTILKGIAPKLKDATIASKTRHGLPRPRTALYATGKLYESIKLRLKGAR